MFRVWALCFVYACSGLVETLTIEDDDRPNFYIETFGYEAGGKMEFEVKDFSLLAPHNYNLPSNNNFNLAFVFQRANNDVVSRDDMSPRTCFHESKLNEDDDIIMMSSRTQWGDMKIEKTVKIPGYYHLFFSNCEPGTHTSFTISLTQYNLDKSGAKVYLSAGKASLPTWFFVICALFVVELIAWLYALAAERNQIRSIHWLMTVVLVLKIMTLFCEAFKFHSLKVSGHNNGWTIVYYIFSFLKGILMFTVIVLIGTGWSYIKPFLTDRDKQIMLAVLVAQVLVNIAMVVVDETSPGSAGWVTWSNLLHLLDLICCCMILLPIVWSIRHLRSAAVADGKAAKNMLRLKSFRTFYLSVVAYVYFTRIIVFLLEATLPFELAWLGTVFAEGAALAFYAITGILFRPKRENPYLALSPEEAAEAEMETRSSA